MMPSGSLTVCVATGGGRAEAARDLASALRFLSPLGTVATDAMTVDGPIADTVRRRLESSDGDWILLLQPGDRLGGDATALEPVLDGDAEAASIEVRRSGVVDNPSVWGPVRLMRRPAVTGALVPDWTGPDPVPVPVHVTPGHTGDAGYRVWSLRQATVEFDGDGRDDRERLALCLYHAGEEHSATRRLTRLHDTSTDPLERARIAGALVPIACAAGRLEVAERVARLQHRQHGSAEAAMWLAMVELMIDRPDLALAPLQRRNETVAGFDADTLAAWDGLCQQRLKMRQAEALALKTVLTDPTDSRRNQAAPDLIGVWGLSGASPAALIDGLDERHLALLVRAVGAVSAPPDALLVALEPIADRVIADEAAAARAGRAAASAGLAEAIEWTARLGAGHPNCPLRLRATGARTTVERLLAAAVLSDRFGDDTGHMERIVPGLDSEYFPAVIEAMRQVASGAVTRFVELASDTPVRSRAIALAISGSAHTGDG